MVGQQEHKANETMRKLVARRQDVALHQAICKHTSLWQAHRLHRFSPQNFNRLSARATSEKVLLERHKSSNGVGQVLNHSSPRCIELADELLKRTRKLMGDSTKNHLIAFSGGIDSSLVAAAVHSVQRKGERVRAVLGVSPAVPQDQILLARRVAEHIGIELTEVSTDEGKDATYIENAGQACFACKSHLYGTLESIMLHVDATEGSRRMYNGTNADDVKDPTRLGLIAARNFSVHSPLENTTKEEVRIVAKHLGLPNWNYAASPCLRSRLALGVKASPEHLRRVELAENYVRSTLADVMDITTNLRVRLFSANRACIEIDETLVEQTRKRDWDDYFVNDLGFSTVVVRAFKSGSVASKIQ